MLIQFNFKNFKSFKNETSLDMTATSIKEHEYNLIYDEKGNKFLKIASIYGANAAGKSNILEAFSFMRYWVLSSFKKSYREETIPLKRYAFDDNFKNSKSEFEVFVKIDKVEYQYGFSIDNRIIYEEWLYKKEQKANSRFKTVFKRANKEIKTSKNLKKISKLAKESITDSTLFLSFLGNTKLEDPIKVFKWFEQTGVINFSNPLNELIYRYDPILQSRYKDREYISKLVSFLKSFDIDIEDIIIEQKELNGNKTFVLVSKHKNSKGNLVKLNFNEESDGTKKMLLLYNIFYDILTTGRTIFIDELDSKLHPILIRKIISIFHDEKTNINNAQLIFTTHNPIILTKEIFRRDEIWFVEKENKESILYSLVEFKSNGKKVRNDASYYKDYLKGKYGAIPIVKEFSFR